MATRKTTSKKPITKRASVKKTVKRNQKFMSFAVTQQTAYWSVLGLVVLVFGTWVTFLSVDIQRIYDAIDASDTRVYLPDDLHKHHHME